jgi:hypothetical protein
MTTEQALLQRIDALQHTVAALVQAIGPRLTREQLCQRRGIHRNTLTSLMERGIVPRPDVNGRWLLSEVIEYEAAERMWMVGNTTDDRPQVRSI